MPMLLPLWKLSCFEKLSNTLTKNRTQPARKERKRIKFKTSQTFEPSSDTSYLEDGLWEPSSQVASIKQPFFSHQKIKKIKNKLLPLLIMKIGYNKIIEYAFSRLACQTEFSFYRLKNKNNLIMQQRSTQYSVRNKFNVINLIPQAWCVTLSDWNGPYKKGMCWEEITGLTLVLMASPDKDDEQDRPTMSILITP